jgi:hydrogenase maturation protease
MTLVIGYGNSLFADDGFGPAVIESLLEQLHGRQTIETISCHQLVPELVEPVAKATTVIFVDANVRLLPAQFDFSPLQLDHDNMNRSSDRSCGTSAHAFSVGSLLDTVVAIYGSRPACWLCSVGPVDLRLGGSLSAGVRNLIPTAVDTILDSVSLTERL